MKGEAGHHQADALLANFSHVVIHSSDPVRAKWASSKLGKERQVACGGSFTPDKEGGIWKELTGQAAFNPSFSEHVEAVLQDQEFQHGMRTGGPKNQFLCDALLIKSLFQKGDFSYNRVWTANIILPT
jgi:hypothetical protein